MPTQPDLFGEAPSPTPKSPAAVRATKDALIASAAHADALIELASALKQRFGERLYLGTSSWSFPGWRHLVWDGRQTYSDSELSRHGLPAYAAHPLLRTVSLDRAFYRALDAAAYARLARQVPDHFRFVVKAPAEITDATLRRPDSGMPVAPNPHFLDPQRALDTAVAPAVAGLGAKLGALVFQMPPLPFALLREPQALAGRLESLWSAVVPALPAGTVAALELRDARALTPALLQQLARHKVRWCLGAHDRMPPAAQQAARMREAGPGDLVCRWNLHRGLRYDEAKNQWAPFDRLQAPDEATRTAIARAAVAALAEGWRAFVTINNKAEGSAPLSVIELAKAILHEAERASDNAP